MQNLSCDMYNEFYFNSFAFSLALKQRLEATQKAKNKEWYLVILRKHVTTVRL